MTDAALEEPEEKKKSGKKPLILGLLLAVVGAAGGYFATSSGILPFALSAKDEAELTRANEDDQAEEMRAEPLPDIAYVELDPIIVSLTQTDQVFQLRFRAQLEVNAKDREDVEKIKPRVIDVLNSYLRALEIEDIKDSSALLKIRAQMLRRVQIVTGRGRVRDLLIMDFVLN